MGSPPAPTRHPTTHPFLSSSSPTPTSSCASSSPTPWPTHWRPAPPPPSWRTTLRPSPLPPSRQPTRATSPPLSPLPTATRAGSKRWAKPRGARASACSCRCASRSPGARRGRKWATSWPCSRPRAAPWPTRARSCRWPTGSRRCARGWRRSKRERRWCWWGYCDEGWRCRGSALVCLSTAAPPSSSLVGRHLVYVQPQRQQDRQQGDVQAEIARRAQLERRGEGR